VANAAAKKRAVANAAYIRNLQLLLGVSNGLYVLGRVLLDDSSVLLSVWFWVTLLFTSLLYGAAYWFIQRTGRASYDAAGELVDGGGDLSVGGQTELAFDVVYLTAASQLAALYSTSAFWLLALIPIFAAYKAWQLAKPFLQQAAAQAKQFQEQQARQQQQQQQQQPTAGKGRKHHK